MGRAAGVCGGAELGRDDLGGSCRTLRLLSHPVPVNSVQGAREVDDNFLRVARSFSATKLQIFATIALPSSVPYILAGLRTSIGRAIVGVVVAEFFMSSKGLGYFINLKANALEMAPAFVAIVLLALFGIALVAIVTYVENRFCNW